MAVLYRTIVGVALGCGALASLASCRQPTRRPAPAAPPTAPASSEAAFSAEPEHDLAPRPRIHRAGAQELTVRNVEAQRESGRLLAAQRAGVQARAVAGSTWVSLGPTDAFKQFNGGQYDAADSGRPNGIAVDPRNPNVLYLGLSGGGVWKTFNALAASGPTWAPLTDALPNLAIGALVLDQANPDTLYLGTGDAFDGAGNTVQKTTDGGVTWQAPVALAGSYPVPNGQPASVASIRALGVHGTVVLAGTDGGLFASTNSGASFRLIDLPNRNGKVLIESIWSVVDLGDGGWVVSGVTACDEASGRAPLTSGVNPSAGCTEGNNGMIWSSPDGATWTISALPSATGIGRMSLAAAGYLDPTKTAVYAFVGSVDNLVTLGFWRSLDRGRTWTNATGVLANPSPDCLTTDLGHDQTWYNQAIIGDPASPDRVVVGGNLCGARTLNGTAATPRWELISHWLPISSGAMTSNGRLNYVHADWHTGIAAVVNGLSRLYVGSDGGLFSTPQAFLPAVAAEAVTWARYNRGLATHLLYSIASGDPTTQNPFLLFSGAQDNGTRFRADPRSPSVFNQPIGGDGIGATVHVSSGGTTYWGSVQFRRLYCSGDTAINCAEGPAWSSLVPNLGGMSQEEEVERAERARALSPDPEDAEPFLIHYANVETDTVGASVLTHSVGRIFVAARNAGGNLEWRPISQDLTGSNTGFGNVGASRTIPGLYGAVGTVSAAPFFTSTTGNTLSTWVVSRPVTPTGNGDRLTGPSSIDFPPVQPPGTTAGQVFIGSFVGVLNNATRSPPPDEQGRLYRTTDRGQNWTSIAGTGTSRLPNVPIYVAKYDPVDPRTIYAGTELGVYVTTDDGVTWNRMGTGLPMVAVRDLYVAKNQEFIRVATYGRGLWEIYPSAAANRGAPGNGDYDRNQVIDWVDVAAMSSRLGVTPATTLPPFYSWILDVGSDLAAPPTQLIDGLDLTALFTTFGGRP